MAFENGHNIMDYIKKTVENYEKDNEIFNDIINILNTYMLRPDWPYCYKEFFRISHHILGQECEWVIKYYNQFKSQAEYGHPSLKEWDKELSEEFKRDIMIFSEMISPIINQCYNYVNNPLGIRKLVRMNSGNYMKIIRMERNDGEHIDFNLHDSDIKFMAEKLIEISNEESI